MQQLQDIEEELKRTNRALRLLSASNQTLLRANDETVLLYDVCRISTEIGGYSLSWVGYKELDNVQSVHPAAFCGYDEGFLSAVRMSWADNEYGFSAMSTAIRTGTTQLRLDILNDPLLAIWHDDARSRNYQSAIALPLQVNGETIGAIAIYAPEPNAFHGKEITLLEELARDLSFGIETVRLRRAHDHANAHIHRLAFFDSLTGLPNRNNLSLLLTGAVAAARDSSKQLALLLLDLDYIREINESYGHEAGDKILVQVAQKLRELSEDNCTIARFGGDDFVIICNQNNPSNATSLAKHILAAIKQPFLIEAHSFSISGSIGIALYPGDADNPADLLSRADLAMSKVKEAGGGYRYYKSKMSHELTRELEILQRLECAVAEGNLELFYQPKVDLHSGMIVGAEALLRWHDSILGAITPTEFIPIAEGRGLMTKIGEWVLKTACQHITQWKKLGLSCRGRIAVNVSARQLEDPYFLERVARIVEESGVSPSNIEMELTESCLMADPERMFELMAELRSLGFNIAIDDFGTGYSSLVYLKRIPIDTLKIDQTFVKNMLDDPNDKAIISTILAIAQQMGLTTVAEGVETEEQRQALLQLGCRNAQGYFFCRPKSVDDFTEKLLKSSCFLTSPL
ncbi:MAG: GGDEF domain-containing protein [Desulfuromonadaceae bacterium]|nr:GGDEF domain-containing protein [Desulfuromonadaceae bacterium]MDD2848068.1 GGDEF domain-containing protein [Desulfuromonadaceae bacterium]MDD4132091.1 GGDEF domain-containing protein [Desulfuromonadaceae bacterium]